VKESKTARRNSTAHSSDTRVVRVAKITLATFEFVAHAATGMVQAGRSGFKKLFSSRTKRTTAPGSGIPISGATAIKNTEREKKTELEETLYQFDKRLKNLEKCLSDSHSGAIILGNGRVAVEIEQYNLLVELAKITKSYLNPPLKKELSKK
jgi:hypothetical protein